jgi:hypothetical protein
MLQSLESIVLQSLQILYMFVLRAEIVTIFGSNIYKLICKLHKAIFSVFYNIGNQILHFY